MGSDPHIEKHRARIEVMGESKIIRIIYGALAPEIETPPNPGRVRASALYEEGKYVIEIISRDISSLRAAINSYIYLIYAALKSLEKARDSD